MKKLLSILCAIAVASCAFVFAAAPVSAKAPADALYYADFNNGPMAQPEEAMQATDEGGQLYINDGPIKAEATLVDGAMKLTLGPSGYYGMNNTQVALRTTSGTLTDYKYLVIRMKGEVGNGAENTLMMSIGGGDGPHMGTFGRGGDPQPYLDPEGCYMPDITTEYQDFVIALSQTNVRVNEGKLVSGLNFNNSSGNITIYVDEIYLTSEVPEGFVSSGVSAGGSGTGTATPDDTTASTIELSIGGTTGGTVAENVVVSGGGSSAMNLAVIIILMVVVLADLVVLVMILLKVTAPAKADADK